MDISWQLQHRHRFSIPPRNPVSKWKLECDWDCCNYNCNCNCCDCDCGYQCDCDCDWWGSLGCSGCGGRKQSLMPPHFKLLST
jgi:hypothetical protein